MTTPRVSFTAKAAGYLDDRTKLSAFVKEYGRKAFPNHWSFELGQVAMYSFIILVLSGTFLTLFFHPAMTEVQYSGSYVPLQGVRMSAAYESTLNISFDIRGGLLMRQIHHWAALIFIAAMGLHMLRNFFTGAFRKPRELNWLLGFTLFVIGMLAGFSGYSLPDDLLSGNGLRIIDGILKGLPIIGTWASFLLFGGEFPGADIVSRLYMVHIMLVPGLLAALIGLHVFLVIWNKHTQFPGPGKTEKNVVGHPILPTYAGKAGGFFFILFGITAFIGAVFTINPIWSYGPYDPAPVSAGTQPDWYIGFADGMLRLMPPGLEVVWLNRTWSFNILIPGAIFSTLLVLVAIYPFIEAAITGDKREHHILDRPRNAPTRTAIGAAGVTMYAVMWAAASSDLLSTHFHLNVFVVTHVLQVSLIVAPIIAYLIAKRVCLGLQKKDRAIALHGVESGKVVRMPNGEYLEVHDPIDEYERWRLVSYNDYKPLMIRPNERGRITIGTRIRAALSRWFFEDRITPVTKSELAAAHGAAPSIESSDESPAPIGSAR